MRTSCVKNGLAFGVILLFVGVAVQPSVATVQPGDINREYIEITTEISGIPEKNHTTKLTIEEAEEIEVLFDCIRERLNNTETREEAEKIFKETVIELEKYGLLGDLSVKQADKLVTKRYCNFRIIKLLENMYNMPNENPDEMENKFCLLIGNTNYEVGSQGPIARTGYLTFYAIANILFSNPIHRLFIYFYENGYKVLSEILLSILIPIYFIILFPFFLVDVYTFLNILFYDFFPFNICSIVGFGCNETILTTGINRVSPANGWLYTYSENGNKNWSGEFYGRLPVPIFFSWLIFGLKIYYPGISGFTGIKLSYRPSDKASLKCFLIGSAYMVKIGSEPLED